ncbi:MAG: triose-phosphate isomerase [Candidatus Staskawiczbacteria bacterium]|nr:triose-phosphate isomerase [Candidatus Staskawiczbacteria bacterium]
MKKLIVANWKMNPSTQKEAVELFNAVKDGVKESENAKVVICPPFIYLSTLKGLTLGAQNVFYKESGAYTGEVSPKQLKDLGVEYVITGHSEVRMYLGETNEVINKKIKESLSEGLKPIFCIGEKEGENKEEVLKRQITEGLRDLSEKESENIVIAYEPVWAIGTGKNCSVEETKKSIEFIKKIVFQDINVLYGGSVKSSNASDYLKNGGVDGLLVGGSSLKPEEFIEIIKLAQ